MMVFVRRAGSLEDILRCAPSNLIRRGKLGGKDILACVSMMGSEAVQICFVYGCLDSPHYKFQVAPSLPETEFVVTHLPALAAYIMQVKEERIEKLDVGECVHFKFRKGK